MFVTWLLLTFVGGIAWQVAFDSASTQWTRGAVVVGGYALGLTGVILGLSVVRRRQKDAQPIKPESAKTDNIADSYEDFARLLLFVHERNLQATDLVLDEPLYLDLHRRYTLWPFIARRSAHRHAETERLLVRRREIVGSGLPKGLVRTIDRSEGEKYFRIELEALATTEWEEMKLNLIRNLVIDYFRTPASFETLRSG